jgi:hypothetical protein
MERNNLHLTALLFRPFLTWKSPQTKRNSHAINTIIPKLAFTLPQRTDDILIISATQGG